MVNPPEYYYAAIRKLLKNSYLIDEFEKIVKFGNPKEVILWLDKNVREGKVPKELLDVLAEFFDSMH